MSASFALASTAPLGSLEAYARLVEQFPQLSAEEERELAERYRRRHDLEAAFKLVVTHLRYVVYVARGYAGYGLPQDDLIQEGNIGLMKAVKRFDPSRGVRLTGYALLWIRAQIHDYILRNWRILRVATSHAKKKLFYNLRRAKKKLEWLSRGEADQIAAELDVSPEDVLEMDQRLYAKDVALEGERDDQAPPELTLADSRFDPARVVAEQDWRDRALERLTLALKSLDLRSRDIVMRRYLSTAKPTLQELAEEYGISAERVRQIEAATLKKLRRLVLAEHAAPAAAR